MEAIALAALSLGAIGGVLTLALKAIAAERKAGEQNARASMLDVNLTGLAAQLADMTNRHREEKERGDRLDDVISQMVASVPVSGAYQRLLQIAGSAKATTGDGARGVHSSTGADARSDTDLLRPGE